MKRLIQKPVQVTRIRRAVLVAGCLIIPLFMFFSAAIAVGISLKGIKDQPALQELSHLLFSRQTMKINRERNPELVDDRLYAIYIAHHFRDIVRNSKLWNSYFSMAFIQRADREFVEQSIRNYPDPTLAEIAEAEAAVYSAVPWDKFKKDIEKIESLIANPFLYLAVAGAILLFYVAFPAIIAALCFRGGLVLLVCGVGVVRKDGLPASRIRVFWRSLITWAAPCIAAVAGVILINPVSRPGQTTLLVVMLAAGMTVWSTLLSDRGIPDRLSGTRLVPR